MARAQQRDPSAGGVWRMHNRGFRTGRERDEYRAVGSGFFDALAAAIGEDRQGALPAGEVERLRERLEREVALERERLERRAATRRTLPPNRRAQ